MGAAGPRAKVVLSGDFNADGRLDLALVSSGGTAAVLLGNGNGTFQAAISHALATLPVAAITADLNRDGRLDLVTVNDVSDSVSVRLGNGDGTFKTGMHYPRR